MFKKLLLLACLFLVANMACAQKVLEVKDISQPNDVYSSTADEAAVIIRCHQSIPLRFVSSMDKSADPFRTELQGSDSVYYIAFPTGNRYRGRELTAFSRGYASVIISLELQPKQLLSFQISDPNSLVDAGCYREHRNKGMLEVKNANYEEARNQFMLAKECSDCNQIENDGNITMVDSLIFYRKEADFALKLLDYKEAGNYYSRIIALNSYDNYASDRLNLCVQSQLQECSTLFTKAEFYFTEKEYDRAKEIYEKIIDKECSSMHIATERLNSIISLQKAKKDHARVFTYEWLKNAPFGFSFGKYNMHKVGGFFQMHFNKVVFDAIRSECMYGDEEFPELNMSFGWTVKIANPVWIHVGPGFTGKMYYGTYLKKVYPEVGYGEDSKLDAKKMGTDLSLPKDEAPDAYEDGWTKANYAIAVSPVIGVTVKYSYFALRLTYQYRWSVESKLQDFIGRNRFLIGAGIAF